MPSKTYLLETLSVPEGQTRTLAILDYAKTNLNVTEIVKISYLSEGEKQVTLRNYINEEFSGTGISKAEAIADCVSAKYPS